jgi:hypothetical protein
VLGPQLDSVERQNPHSLASVNWALVRFGLNHKLIALGGVKADLIARSATYGQLSDGRSRRLPSPRWPPLMRASSHLSLGDSPLLASAR